MDILRGLFFALACGMGIDPKGIHSRRVSHQSLNLPFRKCLNHAHESVPQFIRRDGRNPVRFTKPNQVLAIPTVGINIENILTFKTVLLLSRPLLVPYVKGERR